MSTPSDIITRCPQCAIAFKATAQVLKIANGNVRCGSCLSVFNAASHAVDRPATPNNNNSNKNKEEDESWALDLLANEEQNSDSDTEFDIDLDADDQQDTDENQSLLLDIINNDLHNDQATKKKETSSPIDNDIHIDLEAELGTTFTPSEDLLLDAETDPELTPESDSHLALNVETLNNDHLDSITLQYDNTNPKRWPWFLGTLGLLALLLAQIAWLRFDTLSTQAPYRTYYSKACEALGCTLPTRSDLSQIRTSHLVISSHPEENNILVANAIIVNNASFEQAFPALQLDFRNINNELIARRDFQPAEYLKGELINATIMPATHAVQLALAVVDPGESAINYRINIVPAKP